MNWSGKILSNFERKKYYEIASQLFRSWTSIGANIAEAKNNPSTKDFINKLHISLKEWDETLYRLEILEKWFKEDIAKLKNECKEIIKILVTSIKKTKENQQ